jgi:hypothetical protein
LNYWKRQVSHTTNLHYCIYEEKEVIFETFFTTKEKSEIVAFNNLNTSISRCNNKIAIRRKVLEKKKTSKNRILHAKMLLCATICQIENKKSRIWGFFGLLQNNRLIPHLQLRQLLLNQDTRIGKHLEFFC